jgi:hypothetical protein
VAEAASTARRSSIRHLQVEQQPLLRAQALVPGEQALSLTYGLDGVLDQGQMALCPSALARCDGGSVT